MSDKPIAHLHRGDETRHDGAGWYYTDEEYSDDGSCGAFETREAAVAHAETAGYEVSADAVPGSPEKSGRLSLFNGHRHRYDLGGEA
jgi:hypothetical protein